MSELPKIDYQGMKDYIDNFSLDKEIDKFNKIINKNRYTNVPIRLIPPHNYICNNNNCKKMAIFIINNKYECFWHYYMNEEYD